MSGAKASKSCRFRQELSNEYLLAKIGFDTAENEPFNFHNFSSLEGFNFHGAVVSQAAIDAQRQGVARPPDEEPFWERIPGVSFRKQIIEQEKRQNWERELAGYKSFPDLGQGPAAIGTAAPDGSLSVKRQREAVKNADNVYHVVGRFETSYLQVQSEIGYD